MRRLGKRRWWLMLLGAAAALVVVLGSQWRAAIRRNRSVPDEPFRIAGNLYYVGATGVTAFLLTGPDGHVLIDGGYPETAPLIIASIARLGFDIADVRVLLNSHAHFDHAGGLRELQEASGAELWISEGDADVVAAGGAGDRSFGPLRFLGVGRFPAPRVDRRFEDGATIRVGPLALTAHVTAGHTPGCTSWSFPVRDGDRELLAVSICSLSLLPFMKLVEPESYPGIRSDFERSFRTLRDLPADIFLGAHGSFFDMERKLRARADAEDPADPFVDRDGYLRYIDHAESDSASCSRSSSRAADHPSAALRRRRRAHSASTDMDLRIRGVSKTYSNGVQALRDVTLTIPAGMYGLLGPNGAGKSTLMRILATLQEPDGGSVMLGDPDATGAAQDIDVVRQKDEVRKTLGYLPQEFGVYPKVSAEELLGHFALLKGIADRRARRDVVEALLRQVNLWDVRRQKLGGYSGGMKQRFGVAVALLGSPKLMIVDEPTAGLDPAERVRFLNLLSELGERSVVLLSTHIVEDVSELCTRMAIIDRGEILLEAEPLRAVEELRGRIWRRIVAKAELAAVEREHAVISTKLLSGRTVVHVYSDGAPGPGFEHAEPDLEDVYFSTMAGWIGRRGPAVRP